MTSLKFKLHIYCLKMCHTLKNAAVFWLTVIQRLQCLFALAFPPPLQYFFKL